MLLAFDIGNTNIHMGLWDGERWRLSWRARTVTEKMPDEYAVLVRNFLSTAGVAHQRIKGVVMSSVVPALTPSFQELIWRYLTIEALTVNSDTPLGIGIAIDMPEQAGADRLCNAVALSQLFGAPAVSVDFGTSTNFDVLSADNEYIGGALSMGVRARARCAGKPRRPIAQSGVGATSESNRSQYHARYAVRHFLGLCRHDRQSAAANSKGT